MTDSTNKVKDVDVEALLDSTLDDLEDLPTFQAFPAGAHKALITLALKEVNDVMCVELTAEGIETLALTHPTKDSPIKEGDKASMLFMLNNEFGRGNLKLVAKPLAEALGTKTIAEVVEQAKGIEVVMATTVRKDKEDPDRSYMVIKEIQVV
jgi:hypothetical protein